MNLQELTNEIRTPGSEDRLHRSGQKTASRRSAAHESTTLSQRRLPAQVAGCSANATRGLGASARLLNDSPSRRQRPETSRGKCGCSGTHRTMAWASAKASK
eukprot:6214458-Pleurochrysis_carterae.AAC.5